MITYLFGVVDGAGQMEFGPVGMIGPYGDRADIRSIPYGGISMVVCEVDGWEVDEKDKVDLLNKLLEHQKILEKIMQRQFILPVKFGTTVESEQDIIAIVSRHYERLKKELYEMKDFIEIDVVATWETAAEVRRVAQGDKEVMLLKSEAEKLPPDKRGQKIIEVGMLLEGKLEEHRKEVEKEIYQALKKHCLDMVDHDRLEDRMVMNSSFLLKKDDEPGFFEIVNALDEKLDGTLKFKCLSPLPPHSFRTIVIKKVDRGELKEAIDLFDVTETTTLTELKDRHRQLIKKLHPDKAKKSSAEGEFDTLKKRYAILESVFEDYGRIVSSLDMNRCYVMEFQGGER